jgi:hypothetical protein
VRARLENEDGSFLAEVALPSGTAYVRYGERFFVPVDLLPDPAVLRAVSVYRAPIEGSLVVEP